MNSVLLRAISIGRTAAVLAAVSCAGLSAAGQATHWAFAPLKRPAAPALTKGLRNPVDAFVIQKLSEKKLSLSPAADRRTLIRRVTFDLIGLPPTPDEVSAFVGDRSSDAYEKVVRRLLASPHFGERWAQHWLDVARFAESNGYEHDLDRPQAWRYRDWVVKALNADMPYGQFLRLQVAGDLISPDDFDSRTATGFLRCGPFHITGGNLDPQEMRQEWLTEAVNGIGNTVLGLTVGCARCHDHKFDPIPQADYYRLQAFFASTYNKSQQRASEDEKKRYDDAIKAGDARKKPIDAQIAAIEKPYREMLRKQKMEKLPADIKAALAVPSDKRTPEQKKLAGEAGTLLNVSWDEVVNALNPSDREKRAGLRQQIFAIEREMPGALPEAEGVGEGVQPAPPMHILVRGDVHHPGVEVTAEFPGVVGDLGTKGAKGTEEVRVALAEWLGSPENGLVARVFVNRVWQHLFGRGLVETPNDFGKKGLPPTNPELLEWLADSFSESTKDTKGSRRVGMVGERHGQGIRSRSDDGQGGLGQSVKGLIYLLVTSETYRQGSGFDAKKAAVDPDNRLFWRQNRKRLDAEALRDSSLAAAGTLNLQIGGPSVRVPLEPEVYDTIFTEYEPDNLWPATPDPKQHTRRSLYLFRKRNVRLPMMAVFDQPDMMTSCAARGQTVHALQALTLVNGEFMRQQSCALARRLFKELPSNSDGRVARLFELALGRSPSGREMESTRRFLADQAGLVRGQAGNGSKAADVAVPAGVDRAEFVATADLCLATLNLNEFVFVR